MTKLIEEIHDVDAFLSRPGDYHTSTGHQAYAVLKALAWHPLVDMGEELYFPEGSALFARVCDTPLTPNIEKVSWGTTEDFYQNRLRDYDNWETAFWRELIQNARDAGATRLDMECVEDVYNDPETGDSVAAMRCSAADNGSGMDYDTLMGAFFRKGGSLKVEGSVGGFGDAKNLILTPWLGYEVRTQDVVARGRHEDVYPGLTKRGQRYLKGTKVTVWMPLTKTTTPEHAQFIIEQSSLPHIRFTVNGKRSKGGLPEGNVIMEKPIVMSGGETVGQLIARHSPRSRRHGVYVRSHGIYMFEKHGFAGDFKGVVTVEVNAPPVNVFTTKRDALSYSSSARADLQGLMTTLTTDPRQALRKVRDKKEIVFRGSGAIEVREGRVAEMAADVAAKVSLIEASRRKGLLDLKKGDIADIVGRVSEKIEELGEDEDETETLTPLASTFQTLMAQTGFANIDQIIGAIRLALWKPDFYLYQNVSPWKMPKTLHPETMAKKYHEVLRVWTEVCRFLLVQFGMFEPFGVGWVFDTEYDVEAGESVIGALFVKHEGMDWLLLNPVFIDRTGYGDNVSFKTAGDRFRLTNARDVENLIALAVHEITHMQGIMSHTDAYASALTDNMTVMFRIAPVIKKIVRDAKAAVKEVRASQSKLPEIKWEGHKVHEWSGDSDYVYGYIGNSAVARLMYHGRGYGWSPMVFVPEDSTHVAATKYHRGEWYDEIAKTNTKSEAKRAALNFYTELMEAQPAPLVPRAAWEPLATGGAWQIQKDGNIIGEVVETGDGAFGAWVNGLAVTGPEGRTIFYSSADAAKIEVEGRLAYGAPQPSAPEVEFKWDQEPPVGGWAYGEVKGRSEVSVHRARPYWYKARLWNPDASEWTEGLRGPSFEEAKQAAERMYCERLS